jgi:hypothetical protein
LKILVLRKAQNIDFIGIGGPLELISRTTCGPQSRLLESLVYSVECPFSAKKTTEKKKAKEIPFLQNGLTTTARPNDVEQKCFFTPHLFGDTKNMALSSIHDERNLNKV